MGRPELGGASARVAGRALGLAVVLGALLACGGSQQGNRGQLTFFDDTDNAANYSGIRPIAARALVHMHECCAPGLVNVTSSDPAVLAVTGFSGDAFTLHAGTPGKCRITATASSAEDSDSTDLSVEAIASSKLVFGSSGWFGTVPASFPDVAMAPDAEESMLLTHMDSAGESLTGFGAEPVTATPASAVVPVTDSDAFRLVAPHDVGTIIALHAGALDYNLEVVDPAPATLELRAYGPRTTDGVGDKVGAAFTTVPGYGVLRLDARLSDGRYLLAPCTDFSATSSDPTVVALEPNQSGDAHDAERWFLLDFNATGTATLTLTCLGQTLSYDVTVQQP